MLMSKLYAPIMKNDPSDAEIISHKLMLKAGLIKQSSSGLYSYLPLGLKVIQNISNIIRSKLNKVAQEVQLPILQPANIWQTSDRWDIYGKQMMRLVDRKDHEFCLGPTAEEAMTALIKDQITSYKQLPLILYQITNKYRDELRPQFGLIRSKEFIMNDAYSFTENAESTDELYSIMSNIYKQIFNALDIKYISMQADTGEIGGSVSHEFFALTNNGEAKLKICPNCNYVTDWNIEECPNCKFALVNNNGIEIGHIFKLDTKYSSKLNVKFMNQSGQIVPFHMGCYGIGISRLMAAIIEQHYDKDGIIWPENIAPYKAVIFTCKKELEEKTKQIYEELNDKIDIVYDDRNERPGVKLKDSDLLGYPFRLVVNHDYIEVKVRSTDEIVYVTDNYIQNIINL